MTNTVKNTNSKVIDLIFGLRLNNGSLTKLQEDVLAFGYEVPEPKHYPRLITKAEMER